VFLFFLTIPVFLEPFVNRRRCGSKYALTLTARYLLLSEILIDGGPELLQFINPTNVRSYFSFFKKGKLLKLDLTSIHCWLKGSFVTLRNWSLLHLRRRPAIDSQKLDFNSWWHYHYVSQKYSISTQPWYVSTTFPSLLLIPDPHSSLSLPLLPTLSPFRPPPPRPLPTSGPITRET
jgi:hypothetical protein